jgi:hypothetical protein
MTIPSAAHSIPLAAAAADKEESHSNVIHSSSSSCGNPRGSELDAFFAVTIYSSLSHEPSIKMSGSRSSSAKS